MAELALNKAENEKYNRDEMKLDAYQIKTYERELDVELLEAK